MSDAKNSSAQRAQALRHFAHCIGGLAIGIGSIVLIGWLLDIPTFMSIVPGWPTMKVNTAVCFILTGLPLFWLTSKENSPPALQRRTAKIAAIAVILLGGLTLIEHLTGSNLGIDQLLPKDAALAPQEIAHPGQMSSITALSFVLLGSALLLINVETSGGTRPAQFLGFLVGILCLPALVGYILHGKTVIEESPLYSFMAAHTALMLTLMGLAILCARADRGWMQIFTSEHADGLMLRRLLPAIILTPLVIESIRSLGESQGLYGMEFGHILLVSAIIVAITWITWIVARTLGKIDRQRLRIEESFHASRSRLDGIIDSAMDAIVSVDETQRIVLFNSAAEIMFGCPAEGALGNPLERFIPTRFREQHGQHIQRFSTTHATNRSMGLLGEVWGLRVNGEEFPIEASISQITDGSKKIYTVILRDITERLRAKTELRASKLRLDLVIANMNEGVIIVTTDGSFLHWNPAALRMHGFTHVDEWDMRSIRKIIKFTTLDGTPVPDEQKPLDRLFRGESLNDYELRIARTDTGLERTFSYSGSLIQETDGSQLAFLMIADVTERTLVEKRIRELNVELEQRVTARTKQLETANKELESFSYSVSHDLRAPLRAIHGFSSALTEEYESTLDDTAHRYLKHIRAASLRMSELIDDLLNLARVTRAEIHRAHVDITAIALDIFEQLHATNPGHKVEFSVQENLHAQGDPSLMHAALQNLIDNAWKFTSKQPQPRIDIGFTEKDGDGAYYIKDNGAGFDMAHAGKLFGAFQRLHRADDFPGTGIGLATVQRIINRHGGRVWAESTLGQGATFYFTLPQ